MQQSRKSLITSKLARPPIPSLEMLPTCLVGTAYPQEVYPAKSTENHKAVGSRSDIEKNAL